MSEERIYIIPLKEAYYVPRPKRANKAVKLIREFVKRHAKVERVKLAEEVNEYIWKRNREKPPRRIKVKVVVHREEGEAEVFLAS